jgi:3-hydroxybutyryl-CoA dehydratase
MTDQGGMYIEDLEEGQSASFSKTITDADIVMFAGVSGDTNPVHLDADFAAGTMFKERIAHGMLSASLNQIARARCNLHEPDFEVQSACENW